MAVPTQSEMFGVVLRVMGDDIDRGWRDVQNDVAREVGLTQEEMEQSTPSGVPTYKSRTDWSVPICTAQAWSTVFQEAFIG